KIVRLGEILRQRRVAPAMSLAAQREKFEEDAARMPVNPGARRRAVDAGGVPGEWLESDGAGPGAPVVLYFHGGGYLMGSVDTIRPLAANLAVAAGARVLTIGYRLAPEHPFPAAVVLLATVARTAGVPVTLELYRDMIHVWHAYAPVLPEAMAGIERIAAWLGERWARTAG